MITKKLIVFLAFTTLFATSVSAQEVPSDVYKEVELTAVQTLELQTWNHDYPAWSKWNVKCYNVICRNSSGFVLKRISKPVPPLWLKAKCLDWFLTDKEIILACSFLKEDEEDYGTKILKQLAQAQTNIKELKPKSTFTERLHADVYWPILNSGMYHYGGLFGVHYTIAEMKRVEIFGAPGFMAIRIMNAHGNVELKSAIDYGFSFRMFDFQPPLITRRMVMHFNLARAYYANMGSSLGVDQNLTIGGFSFTFKKNH